MNIYHFIQLREWILAKESDQYEPNSLIKDGFIHCCTQLQINGLARRLYQGQDDLFLLEINEDIVRESVVYEDLYESNQLFPHIYGILNLDAIKGVYQVDSVVEENVTLQRRVDLE
jgi:uncharacterized protein (DUF952 family)